MNQEIQTAHLCPEAEMANVLQAMRGPDTDALHVLDQTVQKWPHDPRVRLLRGATYASQQAYAEAKADFVAALDMAPDYAIVRFMLGFLELTNGQIGLALSAWGPLDLLPPDNALRVFKSGLVSLIQDQFDDALRQLREGMASNQQYPLINNYIAAVIAKIESESAEASTANTRPRLRTYSNPYDPSSNS